MARHSLQPALVALKHNFVAASKQRKQRERERQLGKLQYLMNTIILNAIVSLHSAVPNPFKLFFVVNFVRFADHHLTFLGKFCNFHLQKFCMTFLAYFYIFN